MPVLLDLKQTNAIHEAADGFYSRMGSAPAPEIRMDLHGHSAGQWRMSGGVELLRFNPQAFLRDWHAHFPATIAHEVAHSLVYRHFGTRGLRPHGPEWRRIMASLGFPPTVTHRTLLPGRRSRVYIYNCECQSHRLGPRQHYLVTRRGYRYDCRDCGVRLRFQDQVEWK